MTTTTFMRADQVRVGDRVVFTGEDGVRRAFEVMKARKYASGYCVYAEFEVFGDRVNLRWHVDREVEVLG